MRYFIREFALVTVLAYSIFPCVAAPVTDALAPGKALLLEHEKDAEAVVWFSNAIKSNPKNPLLFEGRGRAYRSQGSLEFTKLGNRSKDYVSFFQKAVDDFSQEILLDPKSEDAYTYRASAYEDLGQLDKAIADFAKAIELDPKRDENYRLRSDILRKKKQFPQALSDSDKALSLIDTKANGHEMSATFIHTYRARVYRDMGQFQKAINDYDKAISIIANAKNLGQVSAFILPGCYEERADVFYRQKQYQKAIDDCKKAMRGEPKVMMALAFITCGKSYSALGQDQKALENYIQAISSYKDFAQAYFERAGVYKKLRKNDLANKDLLAAKKLGYTENYWLH